MGVFHYKDNWLFSRDADGGVKIQHQDAEGVVAMISIDPDSWASILASVSR